MANFITNHFDYVGLTSVSNNDATFVKVTGFTSNAYDGSGFVYLTSSNIATCYYKTDTPPSANYSVSIDVIANSIIASNVGSVIARCSTTESTFYQLALNSSGVVTLVRRLAGVVTTIGSSTVTVASGGTYRIKLVCDGDQISGYVDDVLKIGPITDTNISAVGKAGMGLVAGGGTGPSISTGLALDNLSADTIEASGASSQINATTDDITVSCASYVSPISQISATTADVVFSGASITGTAECQITATLDDVVFSGESVGDTSSGTITSHEFKNIDGMLLDGLTVAKVWLIPLTDTPDFENVTTNVSGQLVLSGAAITSGVSYLLVSSSADGLAVGVRKYTAS